MKKKEQLFILIKSLSKAEKGYFKKYSSRHVIGDKNNYIKLFDILDKQNEYDEKKLKEKYRKESFIKHLAESKYYLQKLIIKSLTAFHSGSLADHKIIEILHSVEILREKGLYDICFTLLEKGKKLALKYERFTLLMELLFTERLVVGDVKDPVLTGKFYRTFSKDIRKYGEYVTNTADAFAFSDTMNVLEIRYGFDRNEKRKKELDRTFAGEFAKYETTPLSFGARRALQVAALLYYRQKGDHLNAYRAAARAVKLMEENPDLTRQILPRYAAILHNALSGCVPFFRLEEFDEYLTKLRKIPEQFPGSDTEELRISIFSALHSEMDKYIKLGEFSSGLHLVREGEAGLRKFKGKLSKVFEIVTVYNMAYLCFGAGEFKLSLKWVNHILNDVQDIRLDVQANARFMGILIHYELGNYDTLDYLLHSTRRFLRQNKRNYRSESCMLELLSSLSDSNDRGTLFARTEKELKMLSMDDTEKMIFEEMDFLSWVESKQTAKSFEQLCREKADAKRMAVEKFLKEKQLVYSS